MKRIDQKIAEIKKSEQRSIIYKIIIGVLMLGFIIYAVITNNKIRSQQATIDEQDYVLKTTYDDLKQSKDDLQKTYDELVATKKSLSISMTPEEFWAETTKTNNVAAYFDYITFGADVKRDPANINESISKIESLGKKGWLYVGKYLDDASMSDENYIKVIYRSDSTAFNFNSRPKKGDFISLTKNSRRIRSSKDYAINTTGSGIGTWSIGLPAYVLEVEEAPGNTMVVRISYFRVEDMN